MYFEKKCVFKGFIALLLAQAVLSGNCLINNQVAIKADEDESALICDVNNDEKFDCEDISYLKKALLNAEKRTDSCDVNADGEVNFFDLSLLKKQALNNEIDSYLSFAYSSSNSIQSDYEISNIELYNSKKQSLYQTGDLSFVNYRMASNGSINYKAGYQEGRVASKKIVYIPCDCILTGVSTNPNYTINVWLYDENKEKISFTNYKPNKTFCVKGSDASYVRFEIGSASENVTPESANESLECTISCNDEKIKTASAILSDIVLSSSNKKIVLLGDSITQGVGSTGYTQFTTTIDGQQYIIRGNGPDYPRADQDYQIGDFIYERGNKKWYEALDGYGWAQQLKTYFESKFNCVVKNYGCSGINTEILGDIVNKKVINSDYDIVIIAIGTNDRTQSSLTTVYNQLYSTVNNIKAHNKDVILIGNIPASIINEENYEYHMEDINHVISKCANDTNVPFVSLYSEFIDYCSDTGVSIDSLLKDGLHPTDQGYEVMFRILCDEFGIVPKRVGATW